MYSTTLIVHSFFRWLVLLGLLYAIINAFRGWRARKPFRKHDSILRQTTVSLAHIQVTLGVILYFTSPITGYFVRNFSEAVHNRGMVFLEWNTSP